MHTMCPEFCRYVCDVVMMKLLHLEYTAEGLRVIKPQFLDYLWRTLERRSPESIYLYPVGCFLIISFISYVKIVIPKQ